MSTSTPVPEEPRSSNQMTISASTQELAELINIHLGDLRPQEPSWRGGRLTYFPVGASLPPEK
ncbi:GM18904 [Drosophila sechellia]|uniref:GM18904 n=1 Tax=Drosophila sechellia TaxID=7238 RepID=B4I9S1_DROSE|nr:GM18904 [Drosophila sechellia]